MQIERNSAIKQNKNQGRDPLDPIDYPELVFGLVGPAGSDLEIVTSILKSELAKVGYDSIEIRLSKLIESFLEVNYSDQYEDTRIENLMADGTRIRESSKRGDAVALLGITEIRSIRNKRQPQKKYNGTAYILRSLKHPHEIENIKKCLLVEVIFTISAYSPREARVDALSERIAKSKHLSSNGGRSEAEKFNRKR